jgi:hypothetical protein
MQDNSPLDAVVVDGILHAAAALSPPGVVRRVLPATELYAATAAPGTAGVGSEESQQGARSCIGAEIRGWHGLGQEARTEPIPPSHLVDPDPPTLT